MSLDAMRWAWHQSVGSASEKLVLLSLSDRVSEELTCWPSIERLEKDTELNRKTVLRCLRSLVKKGFLVATGEHRGHTGRVKVYQLIGVACRHGQSNQPKSGTIQTTHRPTIGTIKQAQNRVSLTHDEARIDPKTERLPSEIDPKKGRLAHETNPKAVPLPEKKHDAIGPILPGNRPKIGSTKQAQNWDSEPISTEPPKEPIKRARAKRATPPPEIFPITDALKSWARQKSITVDLNAETEKFLDYYRAKGSTFKCWVSAWRNWIRKAQEFNPHPRATVTTTRPQVTTKTPEPHSALELAQQGLRNHRSLVSDAELQAMLSPKHPSHQFGLRMHTERKAMLDKVQHLQNQ